MDWLILGKGKMYKESPSEPIQNAQIQETLSINTEPELFDEGNFAEQQIQDLTDYVSYPPAYTQQQHQSESPSNQTQTAINQRKAIKVTIFFDDGTYQDM
jgi:hypothetical protein